MSLLAGVNYDPSGINYASCATKIAMTAIDTTNLTLSFTAPTSGNVLCRLRCVVEGATTFPDILLGIMQHSGGAVIARQCPIGGISGTALATTHVTKEALFTLSGLSGAQTWDAGYAVQVILASTNITYGGPNSTSSAYGGFQFEAWTADNLLGSKMYDPAVAIINQSTASALAMTALDTTNLRISFTAPASGSVLVRLRCVIHGAATFPQILLGVLDGATVRARTAPIGAIQTTALATSSLALEGQAVVTGLTPGNSYTWDAAYGVEVPVTSSDIKYGGPNDASGADAWGGFLYEIWAV